MPSAGRTGAAIPHHEDKEEEHQQAAAERHNPVIPVLDVEIPHQGDCSAGESEQKINHTFFCHSGHSLTVSDTQIT